MKTLLISTALAATALAGAAHAFPAYGNDSGPAVILTFTNSGVQSSNTGQGPYDGVEDTYVGVVNNSSNTIYSINLSSTNQPITGFDGHGLAAYGAPTPYDGYGYGGPQGYFTNLVDAYHGTINFVGGVAPGATTYFSLEYPVNISTFSVPEPTTWALMLVGFGAVGFAARRRKVAAAVA